MTKFFLSMFALLVTITALVVSSSTDFPDDVDQAWELYKVIKTRIKMYPSPCSIILSF